MGGRRAKKSAAQSASQTWEFAPELELSDEERAARAMREERRIAKATAKAKEFDPDNPATWHPMYKLFQGVPTREGIPPISLPGEVCHFLAVHVFDEDKLNCSAPRDPGIVHVDSPAGPRIAMNAGAWVKPSEVPEVAVESVPTPDFSSLSPEALSAIEAGARAARITQLKVAGADPGARADAEVEVAGRGVVSPVPVPGAEAGSV